MLQVPAVFIIILVMVIQLVAMLGVTTLPVFTDKMVMIIVVLPVAILVVATLIFVRMIMVLQLTMLPVVITVVSLVILPVIQFLLIMFPSTLMMRWI